jgi:ferredoxin
VIVAARGAGHGVPGGRRSQADRGPADGSGRGAGMGRGAGTGRGSGMGRGSGSGMGRGSGARRRLRDGSGRSQAVAGAAPKGGDATPVSSPTLTAAPVTVPSTVAATGRRARPVVRLTDPDACIGCGDCVDVCPRSAIELETVALVHEDQCTGCGLCVDACPQGALGLVSP